VAEARDRQRSDDGDDHVRRHIGERAARRSKTSGASDSSTAIASTLARQHSTSR
jgi:hypothetical protein